jgi:hypothetical protein
MPYSPPQFLATLLPALQSQGIVGVQAAALAQGISVGMSSWMATLQVLTQVTGVSGVGTGNGSMKLLTPSGVPLLAAALGGQAFLGIKAPALATSVIRGCAPVLTTQARVLTAVPGVATGVGVGTVINASALTLQGFLLTSLAGAGILGVQSGPLSLALAQGISAWVKTGVITTTVAGAPTIPPVSLASAGTGKFI